MNHLQELKFNESTIRVVNVNGEPYWVLSDICKILCLSNPSSVASGIEFDDLSSIEVIDSIGRTQYANAVNESGLYQVIFMSRKPEAKIFKKWVTSEVLPQIRQNGCYYSLPKNYKEALRELADTVEAKERAELQVKQATAALIAVTPKVEKYDQFLDAGNLISLDIAAKNVGIGRTRLTTALRDRKVFYKPSDNSVNHVYQKYLDAKYFQVKMLPIHKNGVDTNYPQIYVTAKGMSFIQDLFKREVTPISLSS